MKQPVDGGDAVVYAHDVSEKGLEFIARFEGCVLHPYNDPLNATIGVGHLIHTGVVTAADNKKYAGFTRADALALLKEDAAKAVAAVNSLKVNLTQTQFDALVSFAFNCGAGALKGGVLRGLVSKNKNAAMNTLALYNKAGGKVLAGLVRRRAAEAALFEHGSYGF